jgi:hypothetical protein
MCKADGSLGIKCVSPSSGAKVSHVLFLLSDDSDTDLRLDRGEGTGLQ